MQTKKTASGQNLSAELFDQMEEKYGSAFMQDIHDRLGACEAREVQYLEMKQMVEIQFRFRERLRGMVNLYRNWKRDVAAEKDNIEKVYKTYDGMFIRRQLNDAWKMYVTVNHDYHEMYRTYMDQIEKKKAQPFSYKRYRSAA